MNLYHGLVNCVTVTSCVWRTCLGKRKWRTDSTSVFFFFSTALVILSYLSLSLVLTRGIPKPKGYADHISWRMKTKNILHWPRETGNLPAPASGSEIKAVFERSQKHFCCLTSCTCDRLATATLLVLDARKHSLWLFERVHSHLQIILALLVTASDLPMNILNIQLCSGGSDCYVTRTNVGEMGKHSCWQTY